MDNCLCWGVWISGFKGTVEGKLKNSTPESLITRKQKSTNRAAVIFLIPVFLVMIIYIIYPIIETFRLSFFNWNGISSSKIFCGFDNWKALIVDKRFWNAFLNNVIIMVFSILVQIPIGLALASFLEAKGKKYNFFKVVWFLPMLMSSVAIGFLFTYALATNGGIISAISTFFGGGNVDLLGDPKRVLGTIIGIIAWQYIPFYMVFFIAGYSGIGVELYEAAIIDGATKFQYFKRIALPLLYPTIVTACTMSLIGSLKYFDLVYVMTGGGPGTASELMATYMYKESFMSFQMGYGSTIAAGMLILITSIALVINRTLNLRKVDY